MIVPFFCAGDWEGVSRGFWRRGEEGDIRSQSQGTSEPNMSFAISRASLFDFPATAERYVSCAAFWSVSEDVVIARSTAVERGA